MTTVTEAVRVPLCTRDGTVRAAALVDEADAERVLTRTWHLTQNGYAATGGSRSADRSLLHRFILGLDVGDERHVDHKNRDRLDCRRQNLRLTTQQLNNQNLPSRADSTSEYRGVSWNTKRNKWIAQAMVGGKQHNLGEFREEADAARAAFRFRMLEMPGSAEYARGEEILEMWLEAILEYGRLCKAKSAAHMEGKYIKRMDAQGLDPISAAYGRVQALQALHPLLEEELLSPHPVEIAKGCHEDALREFREKVADELREAA